MRSLHFVNLFVLLLILSSCARQTSPTGGPKDTIPPVLISKESIPLNDQTNFRGKDIELTFSEAVAINNPKEQIIITPTIGKDYEIIARKNKVFIKLVNDLLDSTTYTLSFREAIQDITEKNPADNLHLSFSTGPYIDSLSVSGAVSDLLTAKELAEVTVVVQPANDTFNIFKHPATYFTKSDKKGKYTISHLKPGRYMVYALDDKNKNLVVDSRTETYGFLSDTLRLETNTPEKNIGLIYLDLRPLKLTASRPYNTYFVMRFSKGLKNFTLTPSDSSTLHYTFGADNTNIQVYNTITADSIAVNLHAEDSAQFKVDTTLYVKFNQSDVTPEKFSSAFVSGQLLRDKGVLKASVQFSKPIGQINFDSVYFLVDSTRRIPITAADVQHDRPNRIITFEKKIDRAILSAVAPKTNRQGPRERPKADTTATKKILNELHFGKGAFISIEKDSSATIIEALTPQRPEDLGVIIAQVQTSEKNYIIQLLTKDYKLIKQTTNQPKATFEDLLPGDYQLRIIIDTNANGVWDPGDYLTGREPEKIRFYKNEKGNPIISLKANWEIGPLLITY